MDAGGRVALRAEEGERCGRGLGHVGEMPMGRWVRVRDAADPGFDWGGVRWMVGEVQ